MNLKEQRAQLRYSDITPRKMRRIADTLRGLTLNEAEARLSVSPHRAAKKLLKLLQSAAANAKNNQQLNPDNLVISSLRVDGGPVLKRWLPRARGTATPILKRTSHVTVILRESETPVSARFKQKVVVKPKAFKKEEKRTEKKLEHKPPEKEKPAPQKEGLFKRIFRRKAV
jgi:large subunit ribosomal protein L22